MSRWLLLSTGAAASLLFLWMLTTRLLGRTGAVALDDYASVLAPAAAGLVCLRTAMRDRDGCARAWLLMGLSLLSWAAGGVVWTIYAVHLGRQVPTPSLADVGYLLSVPLTVAALLSFPGPPAAAGGAARLRPLLDGVIASGALLFVSWATVFGPAFQAGTVSRLAQAISVAYPVGAVLTATIAMLALTRSRAEHRTKMSLLGLGLLIVAVSDSSYAWYSAHGAYATGALFDTGYVAAALLIASAALWPTASAETRTESVTPSRLALTLPYAPVLIGMACAASLELRQKPLGPFLLYLSMVVILAVLMRQMLSLWVNVRLSRQLHDTVAALRHREVELQHQAFHDPLTGLANRWLLADRIGHALARSRQPGPVILMLADLDDFKAVNDTLGHPAGDELLIGVAERLRSVVRPEDTVARLGGDEFAILLETPDGLADARLVANRLAHALLVPFHVAGVRTVIGASIGIAVADADSTGESLLRDADIAMYAAKAEGNAGCTVYAAELAVANAGRLQLKGELGVALARGELSLKYQPIVDLDTGRLSGVEALIRWAHPTRGTLLPQEFIPLAESTGAILPIGRWVLAQACAQAGRWQQAAPAGARELQLAVNVSGHQLSDPDLIPAITAALTKAGLSPHLLTLEITESVLLADDEPTMAAMLALRNLGVQLAIDDFGTGHSALSRLRRYPIDTLKIDQSFIAALSSEDAPDALITAILALGQGLGMHVIAEGVETEGQLRALRALGCPEAQGFLFARPADPEVIGELLRVGIALVDPAPSQL